MSDGEILVKVEGVSKKFCRSLKRSLFYGVNDILSELNPLKKNGALGSTPNPPLRRDEFWAVDDVSFELRRGECLGLIGHNGAGKTTLLKMLNGLIKPDHGRIEMRGRIGALIALGAGFNPVLTGRENIYVNGSILGLKKREIDAKIDEIIDFAEVREFIDSPVQSYSSGMQVRLGFAVASSFNPDILLLDEVLAVGDMGFQAKCFNRLGEVRKTGTGFILVAHNMHQITRFCDSVLHLKHGRVHYAGQTERGVEMYIREMNEQNAESAGDNGGLENAGSMAVVFSEVFFADPLGRRVTEIASGHPVHLVVRYESRKGEVLNPVLELGLRDHAGELWFHGSSKMSGMELGTLNGSGTLTVAFDRVPANNQRLTASISLWDSSMGELMYWCRGLKLMVTGHPSSTGKVLLDCRWTNASGNPSDE